MLKTLLFASCFSLSVAYVDHSICVCIRLRVFPGSSMLTRRRSNWKTACFSPQLKEDVLHRIPRDRVCEVLTALCRSTWAHARSRRVCDALVEAQQVYMGPREASPKTQHNHHHAPHLGGDRLPVAAVAGTALGQVIASIGACKPSSWKVGL